MSFMEQNSRFPEMVRLALPMLFFCFFHVQFRRMPPFRDAETWQYIALSMSARSKLSLFAIPSQLIGMHSNALMIYFQGRAKKCRWSVPEWSMAELTFVLLPLQSCRYPCYLAVCTSLYTNLSLLFMHVYVYNLRVMWWHHTASHGCLRLGVNGNLKVSNSC